MPDSNRKITRIYIGITVLAVVAAIVIFIQFGFTDSTNISKNRTNSGYVKITDYTCQEIEAQETPIGIIKEYTFFLDDMLSNDVYLSFYTVHQYAKVFLDGENIYSLQPPEGEHISKTVGSNQIMVPIYREDAGKKVTVEITPVYESFRNREVEFLLGSELAIYRNRLLKDLPQLILGAVAVFVGVIFICVAGYNQIRKHRGKRLIALGVFSVMMGIWRLTDTRFTPYMFPKQSVLMFYMSVLMLMLGMIPLMKWIEEYFTEKTRQVMDIYCIVSAIVCLIQLLLQYAKIYDIREMLFVTHILIGVGVVIAVAAVIYERVKYPDRNKAAVGKKLPYICVAGVIADVAAYYIKGNSSGLLFSLLAFLLYIVIMGIATMFNYSEQELQLAEKDRQLAEKERKLTERRIASMMSQIRSHFIFNVLTAISGYCKTDPQKADYILIRFSRYLRTNIRIIEMEGLINFEDELAQVDDYVALEQVRFEDMIVFEKNIEEDNFRIPPLTIQPIVENAIKHGLIEHNLSGVISLHTFKDADYIKIVIKDNGAGFTIKEQDNNDSVGIRNVRYRLENMVNGRLDIDSIPGEGTTVIITIPVKEK